MRLFEEEKIVHVKAKRKGRLQFTEELDEALYISMLKMRGKHRAWVLEWVFSNMVLWILVLFLRAIISNWGVICTGLTQQICIKVTSVCCVENSLEGNWKECRK